MARRLTAGLVVALLLAGCGVQPTGVVDAGPPAEGIQTGRHVVFLRAGAPHPVYRRVLGDSGLNQADSGKAIPILLAELVVGPSDEERDAGIYSEIPPARVTFARAEPGSVTLYADYPAQRLTPLAAVQLSCTVAGTYPNFAVRVLDPAGLDDVKLPDCPSAVRVKMRDG